MLYPFITPIEGDEEKGVVDTLKEAYLIPKKRKFYNTMLQKADLNILEYRPIVEDRHILLSCSTEWDI